MVTVFAYVLLFSTWGLGLLSWLMVLSNFMSRSDLDNQEKFLDISQKKAIFNKLNSISSMQMPTLSPDKVKRAPWGEVAEAEESPNLIPDKIRELMRSSPNHPEVEEIDSSDQIIGVKFEAGNYPPVFGDSDGDGDEDE